MNLPPPLGQALAAALGAEVASASGVAGGSINHAARVTLDDGRTIFVKHHPDAPPGGFVVEAAGLAWLAEAGALRTPEVLAVGDAPGERFLALEWIGRGVGDSQLGECALPTWESPAARFGRGLARLHRFGAPAFGLDHDNVIGPLHQSNLPCDTWVEFLATRRLLPMARAAVDTGALTISAASRIEHLAARLPGLCGPEEPPARLHGDLWGGNAMLDADGGPVVIDPAVYGGHREVDLAMMRLFGGFPAEAFDAYDAEYPLAPGHVDRVELFQLYPVLVHVVLFGGSYAATADRIVGRHL